MLARFRREPGRGRLAHPNIVPIYDFDEDDGTSFIAMEYVEGRELKDYFAANERFAMADVVRIMSQILDALAYSHARGVVHRDVKPANVFITADGSVKVADFGIAHVALEQRKGSVRGTTGYMCQRSRMRSRRQTCFGGVILPFLPGERPYPGRRRRHAEGTERGSLPPSTINVSCRIHRCHRSQGASQRRGTLPDSGRFAAAHREARTAGSALHAIPPRAGAYAIASTMLNEPTPRRRPDPRASHQATVWNVPPAMLPPVRQDHSARASPA